MKKKKKKLGEKKNYLFEYPLFDILRNIVLKSDN